MDPLFLHMFVPSVGHTLALCGLPWRSTKSPQFQLQGQLLARLLSGRARLPPREVMEADHAELLNKWVARVPCRRPLGQPCSVCVCVSWQ